MASVSVSAAPAVKSKRTRIKELAAPYREWLDVVHYIITPTEKDVFLKLDSNRDRDAFINLFWELRDPTRGTPENEYRDEHMKRYKYANRYFGFGSPLPGWKTDRGRIHMLLGPPLSINEVIKNAIYPIVIWEYQEGGKKGLPPVFRIVFYKKHGGGDYQLYIPAVDGPAALIRTGIGEVDAHDYYQLYEKIHDLEPTVAEICFSLIPGENAGEFAPSLQDPILLGKIHDLPKRNINANYARNFLNLKGYVKTSVTTSYINLSTGIHVLRDPVLKMDFVHLALLPERLSVDYSPERDKYYFNFDLMVVVKKGEEVIFQYSKKFPFYYSREELDRQLSEGLIIADYFPIIGGEYQVVTILQNSINQEVSYVENTISTVAPGSSSPRLFGPLVSYHLTPAAGTAQTYSAFKIMGTSFKTDPRNIFGLSDPLYCVFSADKGTHKGPATAALTIICEDERNPYRKSYAFEIPKGKKFELFTPRLEKLHYGNYRLEAVLKAEDGALLDRRESHFQVSPRSIVAHPPTAAKNLAYGNQFLFHTMVAHQYEKINQMARASFHYAQAFALNQTHPELLKNYANLLLKQGQYDLLLKVIENLRRQPQNVFTYHSFKGRALYHQGRYNEAVDTLLEANKIYDSDIAVLNTLGLSLLRSGNRTEAVKALRASLKINDSQPDIKTLLEKLKKEGAKEKNQTKQKTKQK